MNKKSFFGILACLLLLSFAKAQPSLISVSVEGAGFEKRLFTNGTVFFTNRTYVLDNVPSDFDGFYFMASEGKVAEEGVIVPFESGSIYMIAPSAEVMEGWTLVPDSEFNYTDGSLTKLSIFEMEVEANDSVPIPLVTLFPGASPLAKSFITDESQIFVRGNVIDIRIASAGEEIFPQNTDFVFPDDLPSAIDGKNYAVSLVDYEGPVQLRADKEQIVTVAVHHNTVTLPGWTSTGETFPISGTRDYYLYTYNYTNTEDLIEIPPILTTGKTASALVFGENISWENHGIPPGTVITEVLEIGKTTITNPSIVILPDGDYLAACTGALRLNTQSSGVSFFLSKDKGVTWQVQSSNNGLMSYQNLFTHNDELYIMGANAPRGDIIIRKSEDKGVTWTYPESEGDSGWLKTGSFHSAPVPVVEHDGRLWRAFETYNDGSQEVFVMSAPSNSNLLEPSNWTYTNALASDPAWTTPDGLEYDRWIEGNVVVDREGKIVNVLRIDETVNGGVAAIVRLQNVDSITFDPENDFINFPGGGKKFTIRYDSLSDKYWSLTNAVFEEDKTKIHAGIYENGVHCGLLRNHLVLTYSEDLVNWTIKKSLISSNNPFFHGFQYVDWHFEGDDIIGVIRMAYDDDSGLPERQHDANLFTFNRFTDFRKGLPGFEDPLNSIKKDKGVGFWFFGDQLYIEKKSDEIYDLHIFDLNGRLLHAVSSSDEKTIDLPNWHTGVYLVRLMLEDEIISGRIYIP